MNFKSGHLSRIWKIFVLLLFYVLMTNTISAQKIHINAKQQPLNKVLIEIRNTYDLQVSFNDTELSRYSISANRVFNSPDEALDFLLKDTPFVYKQYGKVYLIIPKPNETIHTETPSPITQSRVKKTYRLSGKILDEKTNESLPYTNIQINKTGLVCDNAGNFSFVTELDSVFRLKIHYLGYYVLDTLVADGLRHIFRLTPSAVEMSEVKIEGKLVEYSVQSGSEPGLMRVNHKQATFLPGNGDNTIFSLLRLQPGILAAGEHSSELIIRGNHEGQSLLRYDGFTLFGLKNFNDNISTVNPFTAKDIRVMKSAFGAQFGDVVGGITDISGTEGTPKYRQVKSSINNNTINMFANVPIGKRGALSAAFRKTYYDLYDESDFSVIKRIKENYPKLSDVEIAPDYDFKDFNVKYALKTESGDSYYLSFYSGGDKFDYNARLVRDYLSFSKQTIETNRQNGIATAYKKKWTNGNTSEIVFAGSRMITNHENNAHVFRTRTGKIVYAREQQTINQISEQSITSNHNIAVSRTQNIMFGLCIMNNNTEYSDDSTNVRLTTIEQSGMRVMLFAEDRIRITDISTLTFGVRGNHVFYLKKSYIQPRAAFEISVSENLKFSSAWGVYKQFLVLSAIEDDYGNYHYYRILSNNSTIPVLNAQHFTSGLSYSKKGLLVSAEAYTRRTSGITRYVKYLNNESVFHGNSKTFGIDLLIKQEFKTVSAWLAYTIGRTVEHYPYFPNKLYHRSAHDQTHELKMAAIVSLRPVYISANWVWGSGFPDRTPNVQDFFDTRPYNRLDISINTRFSLKRIKAEAGVSVLNVLNHRNLKYDNFVRIPKGEGTTLDLYIDAVPFSPTLFVNLLF